MHTDDQKVQIVAEIIDIFWLDLDPRLGNALARHIRAPNMLYYKALLAASAR